MQAQKRSFLTWRTSETRGWICNELWNVEFKNSEQGRSVEGFFALGIKSRDMLTFILHLTSKICRPSYYRINNLSQQTVQKKQKLRMTNCSSRIELRKTHYCSTKEENRSG